MKTVKIESLQSLLIEFQDWIVQQHLSGNNQILRMTAEKCANDFLTDKFPSPLELEQFISSRLYTVEQIRIAGDKGEMNHHDVNHLITMLHELKK